MAQRPFTPARSNDNLHDIIVTVATEVVLVIRPASPGFNIEPLRVWPQIPASFEVHGLRRNAGGPLLTANTSLAFNIDGNGTGSPTSSNTLADVIANPLIPSRRGGSREKIGVFSLTGGGVKHECCMWRAPVEKVLQSKKLAIRSPHWNARPLDPKQLIIPTTVQTGTALGQRVLLRFPGGPDAEVWL